MKFREYIIISGKLVLAGKSVENNEALIKSAGDGGLRKK